MVNKILIPLDGSARAEEVLGYIRPFIRGVQTEVILATVCTEVPMGGRAAMVTYEKTLQRDKEYLDAMQKRLSAAGMKVRGVQGRGSAAETLLELAEAEEVSLIATTTHGRTGMSRLVYGSVAEELLRSSKAPVLAIRPSMDKEADRRVVPESKTVSYRRILVPTDGSEASMAIVPLVADLARRWKARVTVFRVEDPAAQLAGASAKGIKAGPAPESYAPPPGRRGADMMVGQFVESGVDATGKTYFGLDPVAEILLFSRREEVDLIALSTHGRSGLSRWVLGSVTESVLRESARPVLAVRSA